MKSLFILCLFPANDDYKSLSDGIVETKQWALKQEYVLIFIPRN